MPLAGLQRCAGQRLARGRRRHANPAGNLPHGGAVGAACPTTTSHPPGRLDHPHRRSRRGVAARQGGAPSAPSRWQATTATPPRRPHSARKVAIVTYYTTREDAAWSDTTPGGRSL